MQLGPAEIAGEREGSADQRFGNRIAARLANGRRYAATTSLWERSGLGQNCEYTPELP
jgi:hypothetical protein